MRAGKAVCGRVRLAGSAVTGTLALLLLLLGLTRTALIGLTRTVLRSTSKPRFASRYGRIPTRRVVRIGLISAWRFGRTGAGGSLLSTLQDTSITLRCLLGGALLKQLSSALGVLSP